MFHNIYQFLQCPGDEWTTAAILNRHPIMRFKHAVVEDVRGVARDEEIQRFEEWLLRENLGECKHRAIRFSRDASCGKHFAERYPYFHGLAVDLAKITEEKYRYSFWDVWYMGLDLLQAIVNDVDDYACFGTNLLMPMDEFIRTAIPKVPYYFGAVFRFHEINELIDNI